MNTPAVQTAFSGAVIAGAAGFAWGYATEPSKSAKEDNGWHYALVLAAIGALVGGFVMAPAADTTATAGL